MTVVCDTLLATWALYVVVVESNVPKTMPLSVSALSLASVEGGSVRVTVTVYVRVVASSSAVTEVNALSGEREGGLGDYPLSSSAVTSTVMTLLPTLVCVRHPAELDDVGRARA